MTFFVRMKAEEPSLSGQLQLANLEKQADQTNKRAR
jgi:hypothetical protein